ncbi:P-loop NTPase fold protein [Candidatus Sumerlaeota bacterium]
MANFRFLPDVPLGETLSARKGIANADGLRFKRYAKILAGAAMDTPEPFTIGVYGGWGSGKTSLMRLMRAEVEEQPETAVPVWFNAWRYEREEHLIIPLLATIVSELEAATDEEKPKLGEKALEGAGKLRDALRSVLYGVSIKGKMGVSGLGDVELGLSPEKMIERNKEPDREAAADRVLDESLYFRAFEKLDKIADQANAPRLVIFVDDLDRCFPERAVALLEGIKLVLNQPNIAFVLGLSEKIIQAYLREKYKKEYNIPPSLYEDYLEKLVQLEFRIPDISGSVRDYVRGLLKREDVFGKIPPETFDEEYEPLVEICGSACKNNPRAIVRFLNRLLVMLRIDEAKREAGEAEEGTQISLVHFGVRNALELKWPDVLEAIEQKILVPHRDAETGNFSGEPAVELAADLLQIFAFFTMPDNQLCELFLGNAEGLKNRLGTKAYDTLANDDSLRRLLRSKPGKEWLKHGHIREKAQAAAEEVQATAEGDGEEEEKKKLKDRWPWAKDFEDGWPIRRGYVMKPGADLAGADLERAYLKHANLTRANLAGAALLLGDFRYADFAGANFAGADLEGADLQGAILEGANLQRAHLTRAILDGANLQNADLRQAKGLTSEQLVSAKTFEGAKLPDYLLIDRNDEELF